MGRKCWESIGLNWGKEFLSQYGKETQKGREIKDLQCFRKF